MFDILAGLVLISIPFFLIYLLDRRLKSKGALFTGQPTRTSKILALLLGLLFAGFSVVEFVSANTISFLFPILAVGLITYGLGAGQLLNKLQSRSGHEPLQAENASIGKSTVEPTAQDDTSLFSQSPFLRSAIRITIILLVSAGIIYAAFWAMLHPNDPLASKIAIGVIVLFGLLALVRFLGFFKFFGNLFK